MKNQKLLKNLKHRLSLLLCLVAFLSVGHNAYATDFQAIYYFDNSVTQWSDVYLIIGKSNWEEAIKMKEIDCGIYVHNLSGWTDATKFFFAESACGFSTTSASGNIDKTPTCSNYTTKITSKPSKFMFVPSKASGTSITGTWSDDIDAVICQLPSVLAGDKIMCYGGEAKNWNQAAYCLKNTSTKADVAAGAMNVEISVGGTAYMFAPIAVAAGTYIHGHWESGCQCAVSNGKAYIVNGKNASISNFTKKNEYGENAVFESNSAGTTTVTFTAETSITQGSNLSVTDVSAAGTSSIGKTNSIKWYISAKAADDYTEYTLTDNTLNTSGLAQGEYTLKAVLYDGNIYVVGGSQDFTVIAGSAPTVLLGAQATVTGSTADLYGYLKFTGCQNVTDFGFIWSDTESDISAATPTGTSVQATSPASIGRDDAGTEFALANYLFQTSATKIYYKAYAINSVGTSYSDEYRELNITGCEKPAKPGDISGAATACKTIASEYSVVAVATATSYKWSLPTGWTITSGSGTRSITATPGDDAVAGNIKVCAVNECGDGDYSNNFAVTVNPLAVAGTVSLSTNSICYGDAAPTVQVEGNVLGGGTGAWSSSNTTVATINADGTNLTIVGVGSTNITYTITGGCGGTKSADDLLTVNAVPEPGTVSATETTICADGTSTLSAQGTTAGVSYQWQKSTTSESTGFEDITGATSATYTASNLAAGTYWFRLKVTNAAGCNDVSVAKQITVNANPSIALAGEGAKSANATYPWEYLTITATTTLTPVWNLKTVPAGFEEDTNYVVETSGKTYKIKSELTASKFTVEATVTDSGSSCSTTAEYDVYINEADPEICN